MLMGQLTRVEQSVFVHWCLLFSRTTSVYRGNEQQKQNLFFLCGIHTHFGYDQCVGDGYALYPQQFPEKAFQRQSLVLVFAVKFNWLALTKSM